ncbi:MAG: hypothetical protein LBD24_00775 [Spirochaetaceae bacterium]|nr:hypothetical protein [Spirochaetaceae bacterium]
MPHAPNNDRSFTAHNNAQTVASCAKRSRASTANSEVTGHGVAPFANNTRPCCATRRRRGVASFGNNTRPCCASAAGGVLHRSETTRGHAVPPPPAAIF